MKATKQMGRHAGNAAAHEKTDSGERGKPQRTAGRREIQGMRPGRNPSQPAPQWKTPRGAEAAAALAAAFRTQPLPCFVVLCTKVSGAKVRFQAYSSQAEAEAVARQLRAVGCPADVEQVAP